MAALESYLLALTMLLSLAFSFPRLSPEQFQGLGPIVPIPPGPVTPVFAEPIPPKLVPAGPVPTGPRTSGPVSSVPRPSGTVASVPRPSRTVSIPYPPTTNEHVVPIRPSPPVSVSSPTNNGDYDDVDAGKCRGWPGCGPGGGGRGRWPPVPGHHYYCQPIDDCGGNTGHGGGFTIHLDDHFAASASDHEN